MKTCCLQEIKKYPLFLEEHASVVIDEEVDHEAGEEDTAEAMGPPGVPGTSDGVSELEDAEEVSGDDGVSKFK